MNNNLIIKLCLNEINKISKPIHSKYNSKIKYTNEYYLTMILFMLNNVNQWSFLVNLKLYKSISPYHYKTIYNKFRLWTSLGIFKNAFENYKTYFSTNLLLIDATSISNKYGSENVVLNVEYKKKKVTKLSLVTNKKGFIHSVLQFDIKNKYKSYSTAIHDVKMIDKHLIDIKNIHNKSKYFYLLADKAYKTKEKKTLSNKNIIIITPDKKMQKLKIKNLKIKN